MGSFTPSKYEIPKDVIQIRDDVLDPLVNNLNIGVSPLSEFNTPYLASLALFTLFPDCKGDKQQNPAILIL